MPIAGAQPPLPRQQQQQQQQQQMLGQELAMESRPDLSTAPQSFVTAPTTREDTTSSSGQTQRTWGTMDHYPHADWQPR